MAAFLTALAVSFGTIFVAEFGDKTQLLVLTLASRLRPAVVIVGTSLAVVTIFGISVGIGELAGRAIPHRAINIVAGIAFLGFGGWTIWRGEQTVEHEITRARKGVLGVALAFFLAELGDKSMLATITLAGRYEALGVWAGASAAEIVLCCAAVLVGRELGGRLPEKALRYGASALFIGLGITMLVAAARG